MRRYLPHLVLSLLLVAGCSSDDDDTNPTLPPAAEAEVEMVEAGASVAGEIFASMVSRLPFLVLPGTPPAEGISWGPDTGGPPNTYIFVLPVDVDDDGDPDSQLNGACFLSGDPSTVGPGFTGTIQVSGTTPGNIGDFTGNLTFTALDDGVRLSGIGTLENNLTGHLMALSVPSDDPLVIRNAAGDPTPAANLCAFNIDGDIDFSTEGPTGGLACTWSFAGNRTNPTITDAVYTDAEGEETPLPDTERDIPCGEGTIEDWVGHWSFDYGCLPPESGHTDYVITRKNATTLSIDDTEEGDGIDYEATVVPGSPHIVRGHFFDGDGDFRYREDFTWSLSDNSDVFTQTSRYEYTQGPNEGMPGFCAARAVRVVGP